MNPSFYRSFRRLFFFMASLAILLVSPTPASEEALLARDGVAAMRVVLSPEAHDETHAAATDLTNMLRRITGASFEIEAGTGRRGIVLGTATDFDALPFPVAFGTGPLDRDDYRLRSGKTALHLIGATPLAVHNAVADLLHRLGYRMFFPTRTWEVLPAIPELRVAVDVTERPDYHSRRVWHATKEWTRRNRTASGFTLQSGHSYGGIIRRNREVFAAHPEYLALRDGERGGSKFCIANPGLRALVVRDAVARVTAETDSLSIDPSDGGGWCECDDCAAMGSVSDRVVLLANAVAEAINDLGLGPKYVGIYAYASHSPPPSVPVHPNVIVNVATGFIRGGYTADELIEQWGRAATMLGLREYYYSYANLPGRGRPADLPYLTRTLPQYHAAGVRFNSANIHDAWGPTGFGQYLMARIMWDVDEAGRVDEIFDDFLEKAFGSAREPMRQFYQAITRFTADQRPALLSEDLIGRMYRHLDAAHALSDNPNIEARLADLVLYTRHVELYLRTVNASGEDRQRLYEDWVRHSYRIAETKMVHTRRMDGRHYAPGGVTPIERIEGRAAALRAEAAPYPDEAIAQFLREGIAHHALLEFSPVEFGQDLIPATPLALPVAPPGAFGNAGRHFGGRTFFLWLEQPGNLTLRVRGGITYRDRGPVRLELYSPLNEMEEAEDRDRETVRPDEQWYDVVLRTRFAGLHRLVTHDGGGRHQVEFPDDIPVCLADGFTPHVGIPSAWFYVPRGTRTIGGHVSTGRGGIWDAEGVQRYDFATQGGEGYFCVPVPPGQDGRAWRLRTWRGAGKVRLMTVPPYLAQSPHRLLLPREVVEADRQEGQEEPLAE